MKTKRGLDSKLSADTNLYNMRFVSTYKVKTNRLQPTAEVNARRGRRKCRTRGWRLHPGHVVEETAQAYDRRQGNSRIDTNQEGHGMVLVGCRVETYTAIPRCRGGC